MKRLSIGLRTIPLFALAFLLPTSTQAAEAVQVIQRSLDRSLLNTQQQVREGIETIEESQRAIREERDVDRAKRLAVRQLQESTERLDAIRGQVAEMESKSNELRVVTAELEEKKMQLEDRSKFFATGMFGSLFANVLAVAGLTLRFPNARLEKRLRRLEIAEKEHALREKGVNIPD